MKFARPINPSLCVAAVLLASAAPSRAAFLDPTGDTFGSGAVQLDITSYDATYSGGRTTFSVHFSGPIAPASAFASNSLVGYIDIDSDKDATTGGTAPWGQSLTGGNSWINFFVPPNPGVPGIPGPTVALGDEDYVDLSSEGNHPGTVDVFQTRDNTVVATVPISYDPDGFSLTVPIVGTGDGSLNFGILAATYAENTDRAPNGDTPATSSPVPEPSGLALLALGALGLILGRLRRDSRSSLHQPPPFPGRRASSPGDWPSPDLGGPDR